MSLLAINKILQLGLETLQPNPLNLNDWLQVELILQAGILSFKQKIQGIPYEKIQRLWTDKFPFSLINTNDITQSLEIILRQGIKTPIRQGCHTLYIYLKPDLAIHDQTITIINYHVKRALDDCYLTLEIISDLDPRLASVAVHSYGNLEWLRTLSLDLKSINKEKLGYNLEYLNSDQACIDLWSCGQYSKRYQDILMTLWTTLWENNILTSTEWVNKWDQVWKTIEPRLSKYKPVDFLTSSK